MRGRKRIHPLIKTGQVFGLWMAIADQKGMTVRCSCACGTVRDVMAKALRIGTSRSCGYKCARRGLLKDQGNTAWRELGE